MNRKRIGANQKRTVVARKKKIVKKVKHSARGFFITVLAFFTAAALIVGGIKGYSLLKSYVDKSDVLDVTHVAVEGVLHSKIDSVKVKKAIAPGMKLYSVAEKKVSDAFSHDVWVDKVELKKKLDGKVYITIRERKPIAVVSIGDIQSVDRDGVLLPLTSELILEMPLFVGLKDSTCTDGRRMLKRKDLSRLVSFLDQTKKIDALNAIVSQVDFSRRDRIRLSCRSFKVILEIDSSNVAESLTRLTYIEPVLKAQSGKPALINMMYQDLAFVIQEEAVKEEVIRIVND
jgi:cell division septal protein FtsQ